MTRSAMFLLSLLSFILCGVIYGQAPGINSNGQAVLVEVDGVKLTLSDFERERPSALFQARNTFYETERKAVDDYVDQYLLERQAQKEGITVAELLKRHVDSALPKDPSDEALRVYYEGLDAVQPYEAVKDQILQHLRERRIAKLKTAYLQTLRGQSAIEFHLAPPRAPLNLTSAQVRGASGAPLTLVEYADFECPYCQQIQPVLDKLEANYKGKLAFAYKDVPLPMHPHAEKAAEAAQCAAVQGKFWEYHDMLYKTKQLEISNLKDDAKSLQLDTNAFDKCLDSGDRADLVKSELAEGQSLGLQGTPSFFINGRFFSGSLSYEQLAAILDEELQKTGGTVHTTASR